MLTEKFSNGDSESANAAFLLQAIKWTYEFPISYQSPLSKMDQSALDNNQNINSTDDLFSKDRQDIFCYKM